MNNLKEINDKQGHHFGDVAIRQMADILRESVSDMGNCYRIGGDEFISILPEIEEEKFNEEILSYVRKDSHYRWLH